MSTVTGIKIAVVIAVALIWLSFFSSLILPTDSPLMVHINSAVKAALFSLLCTTLLGFNRLLRDVRKIRDKFIEMSDMAMNEE